jgi:uncharacterized protein (TIGR01777 family)
MSGSRTYVVSGSSGFIGSRLVAALRGDGHRVVRLVRSPSSTDDDVLWNPQLGARGASRDLIDAVAGVDAVINLAGAGVAEKRWDDAYKRVVLDSRVAATTCLATAIAEAPAPPGAFVSGSASGYYGDTGPQPATEDAPAGATFLSRVASTWEQAAGPAREAGVRVVHPRTGTVAAPGGGAFGRLLPVVKAGVGGRLGSGKQWWSLISLDDEVAALRHLADTPSLEGPVNLTAPEQVTNGDLTERIGRAVHRPTLAFVPRPALRLVLGEFADELLIDQRMSADLLARSGFEFRHPTVDSMVEALVTGE